jgi:hypothetical protein
MYILKQKESQMRTPTFITGFRNSQRIRVIVDGVGFYTTVAGTQDICTNRHRVAVQIALMNLANHRDRARVMRMDLSTGFGFNYVYTNEGSEDVVSVQVDLID